MNKQINVDEEVEIIREAQEQLYEAIEILRGVVKRTGDLHAENYILAPLEIIAGNGHGWLSRDFNLDRWITQLEAPEDDDEQT